MLVERDWCELQPGGIYVKCYNSSSRNCNVDTIKDVCVFFFQAEGGIRVLVRSRGLGDVYKRQPLNGSIDNILIRIPNDRIPLIGWFGGVICLLYTSDAADDLLRVDLGGRGIIKKKTSSEDWPHQPCHWRH